VRECIENGSEGCFMRCEDNLADQLTKNVRQEILKRDALRDLNTVYVLPEKNHL